MKSNSKHELVKLISICGQVAEHKSEKAQEHGKNEDTILPQKSRSNCTDFLPSCKSSV